MPYICVNDGCDFNQVPFSTKSQWKNHLLLDHGYSQETKTFSCLICQEHITDGITNLLNHLANHLEEIALTILPTNPESEDGTDHASILASSESSSESVTRNVVIKSPLLLPMTGIDTQGATERLAHTTSPTGQQELKCLEPGCDRSFHTARDFNKHMRKHTRPVKCPVLTCKHHEHGFPEQRDLSRHIMAQHSAMYNSESIFKCETCTKEFTQQDNYRRHMRDKHGWAGTKYETNKGETLKAVESFDSKSYKLALFFCARDGVKYDIDATVC